MNKKVLAVAISSALAVPMAAQAVSMNMSGQVNRAIAFADDGEGSDVHFVDNTASNTRFRMTGSEDMGNGITAGFKIELSSQSNSSFSIASKAANGGTVGATGGRVQELFFSGNFGKITFGQGPTASDGMADADLSNTWLSDQAAMSIGGSIAFRQANGTASANTAASAYTYYDGNGRRNRLRYDLPSMGPLALSISHDQDEAWGAKAYVYTSLAGGDLSAALGYASTDDTTGRQRFGGSMSFLASNGTSLGLAWQEHDRNNNGRTSEHVRIKLGHRWGNNAISASYGEVTDHLAAGSEAQKIGVGFVHSIPKPKVELYAGYANMSLDDDGTTTTSFQDIDVFHVGSRVKFD